MCETRFMTNAERVLALIRCEPTGLTDSEIRERIGTLNQVSIVFEFRQRNTLPSHLRDPPYQLAYLLAPPQELPGETRRQFAGDRLAHIVLRLTT